MNINRLKKVLAAIPRRAIAWEKQPTMDPRAELLRPLVERWQIAYLWSQPHRIKPALVTEVFGDGRSLLCLYPIMFRPNHFVVRMDSTIDTTRADDWLDEIYESIEDEFYEWPWASAYGFRWHEDENADCDSRLSMGDGSCWDEMRWPRPKNARLSRLIADYEPELEAIADGGPPAHG